MGTPPSQPQFDDALFRQRERTVDNIKRIYAIVYSISFTCMLGQVFGYGQRWLFSAPLSKAFYPGMQLRLLMLLVFTTTVSVFAYQADKFLDLRYALRPPAGENVMPDWDKWDFAVDAASLILTLIPFTMMPMHSPMR